MVSISQKRGVKYGKKKESTTYAKKKALLEENLKKTTKKNTRNLGKRGESPARKLNREKGTSLATKDPKW